MIRLFENALRNPRGFGNQNVKISADNIKAIAAFADGDARTALNTLEMACLLYTSGDWVHTHNMATNLSGEIEYKYEPQVNDLKEMPPQTFQGYRRGDGKAGIRNDCLLYTSRCV